MGIRESLLNTITSVADSDFVRVVTSAGTSSKATVKNLFKGFESNLSAKSSLTNSDYIRVVGSDNEAYKQSVSAIMSTMGVTGLMTKFNNTTYSSVSDLYNAVINNSFMTGAATGSVVSALTNGDSTSTSRIIGYKADATTADILLFSASNGKVIISRIVSGTPTKAYRVALTQLTL